MLKGKMYYRNKKIKYSVKMVHMEDDIYIFIKTRLGEFKLFRDELILDEIKYDVTSIKNHEDMEKYEIKRNEFLNKWNSKSSKDIKEITEEFIRNEIDEEKAEYDKNWKVEKLICDFNYKGCYWEGNIPDAPRKIPMPKCKDVKKEENNIKLSDGILYGLECSLGLTLLKESKGKLNLMQCNALANKFINKLDLDNSALMHKGINWYAKEILSRIDFSEIGKIKII